MPKAHVIGIGRSGVAAARLLKHRGWEVVLSDRRNTSQALRQHQQALECEGITVKLGYTLRLDQSDRPTVAAGSVVARLSNRRPQLIVVSPGVRWDLPILVEARNQGIETIGEMELAWRHRPSDLWVGITGTNGKTTTTALTAAIFQAAGLHAPACGNIGYAACELALQELGVMGAEEQRSRGVEGQTDQSFSWAPGHLGTWAPKPPHASRLTPHSAHSPDWIIAEISSYQIESSLELAPRIGIWTTFTPDHLDRHGTLENYYQIKASLLHRCQQQVINGDDPYLRHLGLDYWRNAYWTSVKGRCELISEQEKGVYLEDGWVVAFGERVLPVASFPMLGAHNLQNLLLAVAAARLAGIEADAIAQGVASFGGVPHRLERVCTLAGVDFVNDSKATNYDAAQVGLASVDPPAILIAGGQAKAGDDASWIQTIQAQTAAVLLIGEAATTFAQRLQQSGYEAYEIVETMEAAVARAAELAQPKNAHVVLLSPACASFDQYESFEHRGEHFRQLCQRQHITK